MKNKREQIKPAIPMSKREERVWRAAIAQATREACLGRPELSEMIDRLKHKEGAPKVWAPSNVYPTAKLGKNVSIGMFCEIGNGVSVGDNSRIGAMTFIPEGVSVGKSVFVGPHCCFSNDLYPPSPKGQWKATVVCDGARLGAGVRVLPGIVIGRGALIGMGSVVTKNVPPDEIWAGCPARRIGKI